MVVGWVLPVLAPVDGLQGDTLEVRRDEIHGTLGQAGTVYIYAGMRRLGAAQMRFLLEQWPCNRDFAWVQIWFQVFFFKSNVNFHQF